MLHSKSTKKTKPKRLTPPRTALSAMGEVVPATSLQKTPNDGLTSWGKLDTCAEVDSDRYSDATDAGPNNRSNEELHDSYAATPYIAPPTAISTRIPQYSGDAYEHTDYISRLAYLHPYDADMASSVLSDTQRLVISLCTGIVVSMLALAPQSMLFLMIILSQLIYLHLTTHKYCLFQAGQCKEHQLSTLPDDWLSEDIPKSDDYLHRELEYQVPNYTVMLPVYKEGLVVIRSLVANIARIIYPRDRLQVMIVTEAQDDVTREALESIEIPSYFEVVIVPPGPPQTKGRACNYALKHATGDYIVIYDAEDQPDPYQLLKTVRCFRLHKQRWGQSKYLACVQSRLNFYNKDETALSGLFAMEYHMQFNYLMPAMVANKMFMPLGGTSNHFTADALYRLKGWDIYNVTEDADIGTRISLQGWEVAMINSRTMEEAPLDVRTWVKQRTRWFKGHMQTFLVHLRTPRRTATTLGAKSFVNFISLMGIATFGAILLIPAILVSALTLVGVRVFEQWQHLAVVTLSVINLLSWIIFTYYAHNRIRKQLQIRLGVFMLLPGYFLLHFVSTFLALRELICKPHYWDKTQHGTSKMYGHVATEPDGTEVDGPSKK